MGFWSRLIGANDDATPRPFAPEIAGVQSYSTFSLLDEHVPEFLRGGQTTASGKTVNERSALRNATFFRAVSLITGTVGMLPLNMHEKLANGDIRKADDHPVHKLLRVKPNKYQTPYQFKSYMQGRALMGGNAFAYKVPGVRGPQALIPMCPSKVKVELTDAYELEYVWQQNKGGSRRLKANEVLHLRAPWSSDGICGDGLLKVAAEALGLAQVTDEAAARMFKNGAYVGGVLQHPKNLSAEAIANLRAQFEERFAGPDNAGRWMVAEEGMEAKPLGVSSKDAEGLAQRKHQAEEVSRYTGVPRPLLMFDETSWGSGIEQLGLFLITYCLLPWFNAWEEVIGQSLLSDAERGRFYAKFNEAALLRGSLKDQAEFFAKAIGGPGAGGFIVPNEARDKMDMNPEPWGNQPAWMQGNQTNDQV